MTADIRWPWIVGVIAIGAAWGPYGAPVTATTPASRPVVVAELFTSGCSSCPPADAVLSQLAHQPAKEVEDHLFTNVAAGENGGRVLRHDGVARVGWHVQSTA